MEREANKEVHQRSFEDWLGYIEGANKLAVEGFLANEDNFRRVMTAPGSRSAHHDWPGGYKEHIRQTMMIIDVNFTIILNSRLLKTLPEEEKFSLSDALTVMFLHDIEKPFMYQFDESGVIETVIKFNKAERKQFRQDIIDEYGFAVTPTMQNALKFVEGVRDEDYVPGERADQPLAVLCHAADNLSARGFYGYDTNNH